MLYHRQALEQDPQRLTLKDIEQYANLLARYAVDVARNVRGKSGRKQADELLDDARKALDWLVDAQPPGGRRETVERLNLYGSIHKRAAMIQGDKAAIRGKVKDMRVAYELAHTCAEKNFGGTYYSMLNIIAASLIEWTKRDTFRWAIRQYRNADNEETRILIDDVFEAPRSVLFESEVQLRELLEKGVAAEYISADDVKLLTVYEIEGMSGEELGERVGLDPKAEMSAVSCPVNPEDLSCGVCQ